MKDVEVTLTIANFTYEKSPGDVSDRKLLVISKPDDAFFGIEIQDNDLTPIQPMIDYLVERTVMDEQLREKYGIKDRDFRYRRFKEGKIGNLIESAITVK